MFSGAHLHLLLNHLPIIVPALGLLLLAIALWRGDDGLARVGLAFYVGGALSTLPTYLTGDGAEGAVRGLPGVTRASIEPHTNMAVYAAIVVGVLGVFALWALWRYRRPAVLPARVRWIAIGGGMVCAAVMAYTGLLGGRIRHTEVRPGFVPAAAPDGRGARATDGRSTHD